MEGIREFLGDNHFNAARHMCVALLHGETGPFDLYEASIVRDGDFPNGFIPFGPYYETLSRVEMEDAMDGMNILLRELPDNALERLEDWRAGPPTGARAQAIRDEAARVIQAAHAAHAADVQAAQAQANPAPAAAPVQDETATEVDESEDTRSIFSDDSTMEEEASAPEALVLPEPEAAAVAAPAFRRVTWRSRGVQAVYDANVGAHADAEMAQQMAYGFMAWHNCRCELCQVQRARGWQVYPLEVVRATGERFRRTREEARQIARNSVPCEAEAWARRLHEVWRPHW
jgi:hypothetical protein